MLTQYFFATIFMISYPLLRGNQTGYLLPLTTLVNIFTRIEQELTFIKTSYPKTYSNLTLQKKTALNSFKNNQFIIIKPCDKGGGIYIMNTRDYLDKNGTSARP